MRYQWWDSCSHLTNTVRSKPGEKAWLRYVAATQKCSAVPRPLVFRAMGRRHRKLSSCYTLGRADCTGRQKLCSCHILRLRPPQVLGAAPRCARALDAPRDHTILLLLNSNFLGGAKLRLECSLLKILQACKKRAETSK